MLAASKRIAGSGDSPSMFEHPLPEMRNTPEPPKVWPRNAPSYFHVLAKPTGAICNLDCKYCFFLSKDALYPGSKFRMSDDVLEAYIKQVVESQRSDQITIAWQGGEPTLMGLEIGRASCRERVYGTV